MLCERCQQRPATIHLMEIINNQKREIELCEVCAREIQAQSYPLLPPLSLPHFLAGLLEHGFNVDYPGRGDEAEIKCENCGLPESRFIEQGLLGCGSCYRFFEEKLEPLLRRIQGVTVHAGKKPANGMKGGARLKKEIEEMRKTLRRAVGREEYEEAARIRDVIRAMEERLEQGDER